MRHYFISEEAHFDVGIHTNKKLTTFNLALGFIDFLLSKENDVWVMLIAIGIPFYKVKAIGFKIN